MYQTEFCRIEYLEDIDAVLCTWKQFCFGDDYRNPLRHGLELLKQHGCRNWITDTTDGFESSPEDTAWLLNEFLPKTVESSCKNLFFIIAQDSPLESEIKGQADALGEFFNVFLCENLHAVRTRLVQEGFA